MDSQIFYRSCVKKALAFLRLSGQCRKHRRRERRPRRSSGYDAEGSCPQRVAYYRLRRSERRGRRSLRLFPFLTIDVGGQDWVLSDSQKGSAARGSAPLGSNIPVELFHQPVQAGDLDAFVDEPVRGGAQGVDDHRGTQEHAQQLEEGGGAQPGELSTDGGQEH